MDDPEIGVGEPQAVVAPCAAHVGRAEAAREAAHAASIVRTSRREWRDFARHRPYATPTSTVEGGRRADLVRLDADPLAGGRRTRRVCLTVLDGRHDARGRRARGLAAAVCATNLVTHSQAPPPAPAMNTRFAVAVHVLTLLAQHEREPVTSEYLAGSVHTHPSLIRRLLLQLARAGLTTSQMGTGGGALLARPADAITLRDVYRAVGEDRDVLPLHALPNPQCPVGRHIQAVLETRIDAAERAMQDELARTTIADLAGDVTRRDRRRAASARVG